MERHGRHIRRNYKGDEQNFHYINNKNIQIKVTLR